MDKETVGQVGAVKLLDLLRKNRVLPRSHWVLFFRPPFALALTPCVFSASFPAESKSKRDVTKVRMFTRRPFLSSGHHVTVADAQPHASATFDLRWIDLLLFPAE